jgi:hypothetical protein
MDKINSVHKMKQAREIHVYSIDPVIIEKIRNFDVESSIEKLIDEYPAYLMVIAAFVLDNVRDGSIFKKNLDILIQRGWDINASSKIYGHEIVPETPLIRAAEFRNVQKMKFLIEKGADVNTYVELTGEDYNYDSSVVDALFRGHDCSSYGTDVKEIEEAIDLLEENNVTHIMLEAEYESWVGVYITNKQSEKIDNFISSFRIITGNTYKNEGCIIPPPVSIPKVNLLGIAQYMLFFGWIPIGDKGKVPIYKGWDKTPMDQAEDLIRDTVNKSKIDTIGVLTGKPSGIVVVDIDNKNDTLEKWKNLVSKNGLPETFTVITGTNGFHLYFKYDNLTSKLIGTRLRGYDVDIRTTGGQIVAPGSINQNTLQLYVISSGYRALTAGGHKIPIISAMPQWLYQFIINNSG